MKRNSTILFLFISLSTLAQFPAPTNFSLQGHYVELDKCEPCLVYYHDLCGPTYCSAFSWQAPTETTTATFDHYKIYGKYNNQIVFSETEITISHWAQTAPLGDFWVTAVYTNPAGESLPSNIVTGWEALPTSNNKVQSIKENIIFSSIEQTLMVNSNKTILKMNLINSNGRIIKCIQNPSKITNIRELPRGFYIVEVYCESTDVLRQKIIK
jgi:hypothetical protein